MKPDPTNTHTIAGRSPALAQAVDAPLTRAAIFLVATLNPGPENRATLRSFCGDLAALVRAVEFRDLERARGGTCLRQDQPLMSGRTAYGRGADNPRNVQHPLQRGAQAIIAANDGAYFRDQTRSV
jgi:hypothetical protein